MSIVCIFLPNASTVDRHLQTTDRCIFIAVSVSPINIESMSNSGALDAIEKNSPVKG